jgi:hypothetical protein
MILLLSTICVILLGIVIAIVPAAMKAGRRLQEYEQFYEDTLEDVSSVIEMLEQLMKRELLSDNPDIQNLHKVISITHNILMGYRLAGDRKEEKEK